MEYGSAGADVLTLESHVLGIVPGAGKGGGLGRIESRPSAVFLGYQEIGGLRRKPGDVWIYGGSVPVRKEFRSGNLTEGRVYIASVYAVITALGCVQEGEIEKV